MDSATRWRVGRIPVGILSRGCQRPPTGSGVEYIDVHFPEANSLRALAAPLSLCSRRLTRWSWSAISGQTSSVDEGVVSRHSPFLEPGWTPSLPLIVFLVSLLLGIVLVDRG